MSVTRSGDADGKPGKGALTRGEALRMALARLRNGGIEQPEADARALLAHVAGLTPLDLAAGAREPLGPGRFEALEAALARRLSGEPVGRIKGQRDFWGLPFALGPDTLEPRPDSEAVVAEALALLAGRMRQALGILDLGTGTGCLLIALLHELPAAQGLGVDLSQGALDIAASNAAANRVGARASWRRGSWAEGLEGRFDVVVSNPPYIASGDIPHLAREVREHDPALALDGGADGLDAYRLILADMPRIVVPGGLVVVEIGAGQGQAIREIGAHAGLALVSSRADLGGHVRALAFTA